MREYFVIMVKENDTTNLKLMTEKLNEGFYLDTHINVGRSTVITLQRRQETPRRYHTEGLDAVPSPVGMTMSGAVSNGSNF